MLKASINRFGDRSKIKIPKIRSFCNLKSVKISKKCGKIFSVSILEDKTSTKHKKITPNEVGDQCIYFTYIFYYFKNATPFKSMSNKVVISFYSIFAPIQLIKGLIFDLSKLDLSSIWLFDTFNMLNVC